MILLAIDTSSMLCAACIYDGDTDKELGRAVLDLGKGHAEHLIGVVHDAMAQAGVDFHDLGRIVVSVGPGSFTGVRVGVSAARGFAMALKLPAVGVTTLEAIAAEARGSVGARKVMAALDAGRGEVHLAVYDEAGAVLFGPVATTLQGAAAIAQGAFAPAGRLVGGNGRQRSGRQDLKPAHPGRPPTSVSTHALAR